MSLDRLKRELALFVERVMAGTRFHRLYPGRVVSQSGDVVEVTLDDASMVVPPVPLRVGLPGWQIKVAPGARVMVGFEGGDPARPFAALWEPGNATLNRFNGGSHRIARVDDTTANGSLSVTALPVPGVPPTSSLVITYTPPSGPPTVMTVLGLPPGVTVVGGPASLVGTITSGKEGLEA